MSRARPPAPATLALALMAALAIGDICAPPPGRAQGAEPHQAPRPLGSFVVGRWLERHAEVRGLVHAARDDMRLVAIEDDTGVTFCGRRQRAASVECRLERGARLVPGPPRRPINASGRATIGLLLDGPRGALEVILDPQDGLTEQVADERPVDARASEAEFEPPWPRRPEASDVRERALRVSRARGGAVTVPEWIAPMLRRGAGGDAFVVARRDGQIVQVVHGVSTEGRETSLLLVHHRGAWSRGRVRPSTVHSARFLDALAPGAIGVIELESTVGSSLDVPMGARAFLLVVQVGGRSLTSLGQLEVGGVAWTRSSPDRSDVARWFYEARVDAPGRVVLTLDHAYAGVFDRRVSGFVGATRPFDPATTIQLDEGADVLHPRDLGGSYVLGARGFARAP